MFKVRERNKANLISHNENQSIILNSGYYDE